MRPFVGSSTPRTGAGRISSRTLPAVSELHQRRPGAARVTTLVAVRVTAAQVPSRRDGLGRPTARRPHPTTTESVSTPAAPAAWNGIGLCGEDVATEPVTSLPARPIRRDDELQRRGLDGHR